MSYRENRAASGMDLCCHHRGSDLGEYCFFSGATLRSMGPARGKPNRPRKSIAVLPFENLSDDKANAYFADRHSG